LEEITLTIDGKQISCASGTSILKAAEEHDIKIPTLCNHHSLKPVGACRICLVEDEKSGRLFASCVTPVVQDMVILTDSSSVIKHRRNIVRLMIAEHPESCIVCNKGNRCQLRQVAADLGVGKIDLYPMPHYTGLEEANPFIIRDLSKCILCGKCIRADHELVAAGAIDYNLRGFESRPATAHDLPLELSNCTFCGTCISICPTGALSSKSLYAGTPEKEEVSVCGFCGVGCSLKLGVSGEQVVEVNPSHKPDSVNDATLCVRGHFAHDFLNSKSRLLRPLIRENGSRRDDPLVEASWDDAADLVAGRLVEIQKKSGPQSIGFLGSSKCTNEENYLFQKIARAVLKTNNIDNGGYIYGRELYSIIEERGSTADGISFMAGSLAGLEKAEAVFVLGADPDHSVPVASYFIKRGVKNGMPVIVADHRKTGLVDMGSLWLRPLNDNGSGKEMVELINSISKTLLANDAYDSAFVDNFAEGFEDYKEGLFLQEGSADIADDKLAKAATLLEGKKIAFVVGSGIAQLKYGAEVMGAVLDLAVVTGSTRDSGAGIHVIAKESNLAGSWHMGTVPDALPGHCLLSDDTARSQWEQKWETEISSLPGADMIQMIEKAEKGELKALYIMGENPLRCLPDPVRVLKAFEKIDFIAVQDILGSETTGIADVVLPGAAFSEKEGSFINMEGKVQTFSAAVKPPGIAKPDLEILGIVAEKMGAAGYNITAEKIREEIDEVVPIFSNSGLEKVWQSQNTGEKKGIRFSKVFQAGDEERDSNYPFTAFLGAMRYHLGCGTRTSASERISGFEYKGGVRISPDDSRRLDLKDGDVVRVVSRSGSIERKITIEKGLGKGMIFVPLGFNNNDARNLVELTPLLKSGAGSWNMCRVEIEKV